MNLAVQNPQQSDPTPLRPCLRFDRVPIREFNFGNDISVIQSPNRAAEFFLGKAKELAPPPTKHDTCNTLAAWRVRRITSHIHANLHAVIHVTDLARMVGLSRPHFARTFSATFGHTPHSFIVQCRLERAKKLMRRNVTALPDIALECGFADQAHFTRNFRKYMGITPGRWRRELVQFPTRQTDNIEVSR